MRRFIAILSSLLTGAFFVGFAQSPIKKPVTASVLPDSADVEYYHKHHFLRGAAMVTGLNLGVWALDRYIQKGDYAYISLRSIRENLKEGFNWDNDQLSTNMFMHPYHGNLYFNAGRSNGFNFWQSSLFALGGSAMWELFMENEYPSTNDIIATPVGGTALGEVTYRASDLILKDNTRGSERFWRETAAFLVSPMHGLTRIINGDAWRYRPTSGRQFGIPNISAEVSVGLRTIGFKHNVFDYKMGLATELNIDYGDRFELRSTTPYDYFKLRANFNIQPSQPLLGQLSIMGRLISREIVDTKKDDLSIGLYQHFDYYDSDTISKKTNKTPYKLGIPASLGVGLMYRGIEHRCVTIDAFSHLNAIILGGILSDHYQVVDRNYNLASGFSVKSGANVVFGKDVFALSAGYEYYRLYTWGYPRSTDIVHANPRTLNAAGDQSVAYFGVGKLRADLRLSQNWYLTATFNAYSRSTRYRDYPDVHSHSFTSRLMLTYKF